MVKDVAERLKVAKATLCQRIPDRQLRAIGNGWRIAHADLELFLTRHDTAPRAPRRPLRAGDGLDARP